jgi:hypothetical protein
LPLPKSQGRGFWPKDTATVPGYEPWGRPTSLDAANQQSRATDSAIGFGGSQIYLVSSTASAYGYGFSYSLFSKNLSAPRVRQLLGALNF